MTRTIKDFFIEYQVKHGTPPDEEDWSAYVEHNTIPDEEEWMAYYDQMIDEAELLEGEDDE